MTQWYTVLSFNMNMQSREISVREVIGYDEGNGWSSVSKSKYFFLRRYLHFSTENHLVSNPIGTGGSFPEGKAVGAWS
jgi:hypothetical protein